MTLGTRFETQPNAITALRLLLASTVVVWHAFLITGHQEDLYEPARQLLESGAVDGFFALSGFLILRAWERRRGLVPFIAARVFRVLPGLWVCLVITSFVLAPMAGVDASASEQLRYVWGNALVMVTQPGTGDQVGMGWNLSLWSLWWEVLCYTAVIVLGTLGLLGRRALAVIAFGLWTVLLAFMASGIWPNIPGVLWASAIPRLGFMFVVGALFWRFRMVVPTNGRWLLTAAVVLVGSTLLPTYQVLGGVALAFLVIVGGIALGRFRFLADWQTDLSYGLYIFGYPIQLAVLSTTWGAWPLVNASLGLVLASALAWCSWRLVERPCIRATRRRTIARPSDEEVMVSPHVPTG